MLDRRDEEPFSSHHIKGGMYYQYSLSLSMLTLPFLVPTYSFEAQMGYGIGQIVNKVMREGESGNL